MKLALNTEFSLYELDGKAYCDSLQIAEDYERPHYEIMKSIEGETRDGKHINGLLDELIQCRVNTRDYFIKVKYKDSRNRSQPKYIMTRDGFMILIMGFSGTKALQHKLAYIHRFNQMESYIHHLQAARFDFPAFTDAIAGAHDEPKPHHFINELNLIYVIVLGVTAKKYRELHGIPKGEIIRPYLTAEQIQAIEALQRVDIGLHEAGLPYDERKRILTAKHNRVLALAS